MQNALNSQANCVRRLGAVKKIAFALSFALAAAAAPAEADPIALVLKKGDVLTWTHKLKKTSQRDNAAPTSAVSQTPFTMRVLDANADGYVVEFQHGRTVLDPAHAEAAADSRMQDIMSLVEQAKIRIALSNVGDLGDIQNLPELQALTQKMIDSVIALKPGDDPEAIRRSLQSMFSSAEGIKAAALKDVPSLFLCAGLDPADAGPNVSDVELTNPFGGNPLPAKQTLTIRRPAPASDTAEADVVQTVDNAAYVKALSDFVARTKGKPIPDEEQKAYLASMKESAVQIVMQATCDVKTGLSRVSSVTNIGAAPGRRDETGEEFVAAP